MSNVLSSQDFEHAHMHWMRTAKHLEDKENTTNKVETYKVDCDKTYDANRGNGSSVKAKPQEKC